MFVRESGNKAGPLVVFLHGGGVSGWMWDKQLQYFGRDYHVLVPDLPGHGKSLEQADFSMRASAEEVVMLMEEKSDGKKVSVVGFSLGAQITLEILHQKPDLVDYAVVNSALVRSMPLARGLIKPTIKTTAFLVKNRSFARLQAKELYIGEEYFETYFAETNQMRSETLIKVLEENMAFTLPKNFDQAQAKILVTIGEKEKGIMKKSAQDIVRGHANSKGIIFSGIGHGISLADPDLFNRTVEAWINEIPLPNGLRFIE